MSVKRIISPRRHTPEIELPAPVIPSQGVIETSDKQYSEDVLHVLMCYNYILIKFLYLIFAQTNKLTHRH